MNELLDRFEGMNAAEWDEDEGSPISRPKSTAPAPAHLPTGGGLAASRLSVLPDLETENQSSDERQEITPVVKLEFGKMVHEEILKARGMGPASAAKAVVPTLPTRSRAPVKEPFKPVKPATCWFWATPKKECRFTAEECRYLHAFQPTRLDEPVNLHTSKPTWRPLVDSQPSAFIPHTYLDSLSVPQITNDFRGRTKTCWYWANDGKCKYTAENCRYLHEHIAEGVAPRPAKMHSWLRNKGKDYVDANGTGNDEEEVGGAGSRANHCGVIGDEGVAGLGRYTPMEEFPSRWGRADDKYKPRHIKGSEGWPSGKLIKVVNVSDLHNVETSPKIERCEYLASYNWLDDPKYPTILVPGSPPLWSPLLSTKCLEQDSGKYFRDPNAARYPHCPIEPAFRALLAMHPDLDLSSFDVVGCGSTLGNLLRFCGGIDKDFRLDIDRVGDTVFFIRKESSPTALIPDVYGYGHSFPEAHTMWEPVVKGSASHQRIIQYDFGGLKFLVRSESDGYLKQAARLDAQPNDAETAHTSKVLPESREKLAKAQEEGEADNYALLEALGVTRGPSSTVRPLHIEMRGRRIPQKAIFDLKTRAKETLRPIDMDEVYPRLWVNQTPYFIFAEHFRGSFEPQDIQPVIISDGILKWEKDREELLKHYQATVMKIIAVTRRSATGKLQAIRRGSGPLEIRERVAGDDANVLPQDLRNKW